VLLVVPGLAVLTLLAVVGPVIEIEHRRVFAALRRSAQLTRHHIASVLLLATVPLLVVAELEAIAPNPDRGGEIAEFLPKTIVLVLLGTVVSLLFGIPLGIYQAVKRYTVGDYALTGLSFIGYATPTFFVGLLLIQWFQIDIHLFPPAPQSSSVLGVLSNPAGLVLPVLAYAFVLYALWSRFMRSSVMDNLVQDYVRTARAKGASERRVLWGHVFRNSLTAIVTLLGLSLPTLVGGAIFVEVVFNYPGMGLAFYNAAQNFDFATLLGFTVLATAATIIGNLLADVAYAAIDPRVRYS
jgi:peptide/nickel transport system permease protein